MAELENSGIPLTHRSDDILLYHWSPSMRRDKIAKKGMRIKSRSVDDLWNPPFICFSDSPMLAWSLSAGRADLQASHTRYSWDLWVGWSIDLGDREVIPFDDATPREYRFYHDIKPKYLWFVGRRTIQGVKG